MSETTMERLVIAAPENVAVRLTGILRTAGIAPASVCHAGAQALVVAGEDAALDDGAAHGADDEVGAGALAGQGEMMGVAPVEGVVFADDAADFHNAYLKIS